jgi:hypothetical protein
VEREEDTPFCSTPYYVPYLVEREEDTNHCHTGEDLNIYNIMEREEGTNHCHTGGR